VLSFAVAALAVGCSLARGGNALVDGGPPGVDAPTGADAFGFDAPPEVDACMPTASTDPCGGGDDDCDGMLDEDCVCTDGMMEACGCPGGMRACVANRWQPCVGGDPTRYFVDADGDLHGDGMAPTMSACTAPPGYVEDGTDCDDACTACNPAAPEICDGLDNDCVGGADDGLPTERWSIDMDGDGYGDQAAGFDACGDPGPGYVMDETDCDDSNGAWNPAYPEELCGDSVDNDCDGTTDSGCYCDIYSVAGHGEYVYCSNGMDWAPARADCTRLGGQLAVLQSRAEQDAVWTAIGGDVPMDEYVWLGGSDSATEAQWVWIDGAPIGLCVVSPGVRCTCTECNWGPNQPSLSSDDCLSMFQGYGGQWSDRTCDDPEGYLCELR
jgi:hypothetical protein